MTHRLARFVCLAFAIATVSARTSAATTLPPNFQETPIFTGLTFPTVVRFAPDGRVFIAEKSGLIKVFASLAATAPTIFADLRPQVHDYWDRGLLGMALDPAFPARPYVYVLYTLDRNPADPLATIPTWGDTCPTPPGPTASGCPALGRVSRLDASAPWPVHSTEQVLLEAFPQQFPSHSIGALQFGADGALYVSSGEGANFLDIDYGQFGGTNGTGPGQRVPRNPLGDPPGGAGGVMLPPTAQGGALRAQSVRRPAGQPAALSGALLRIDPDTGLGLPDNPLAGSADLNARRIVAFGLRNPFRFAIRPGTSEAWIGDVGWSLTEEINRLNVAAGAAGNFGWPCYEGNAPQPSYQPAGLASCIGLYLDGTARRPFFSYDHTAQVVGGETCPTGSSSVSGLAFYTGGTYPGQYAGALFFTDWSRHCIWAMLTDANGVPDPARVTSFASEMPGGSVHLEIGPGGDLFYADYDLGRLVQISYFASNLPPTARISASPISGSSPLLVQFDATGSTDPEGGALTYSWDLDGNGVFGDSTAAAPSFTFTTSGRHVVSLTVTDGQGASSTARTTVYTDDQPPHAAIASPSASLTWKVGDTIFFSGTGTDPEEGALPPSAFQWTLLMHHCPSNCHIHTIQQWTGIAGGSFSAPDHEYPSWLELTLTVTDSVGRTDTTSVTLQPQTVNVTINTAPQGLTIALGSTADVTPFTRTVIVGSSNSVAAASLQTVGTQQYVFVSWSDAGAASHQIVAPATALTLTAQYQAIASLSLTHAAQAAAVKGGRETMIATVSNAGPATATGVVLIETLPVGAAFVSASPGGVCAAAGTTVTCSLGSIASGGSSAVMLVVRPNQLGTRQFTGSVTGAQSDLNLADNSASSSFAVRPVGDFNGDGNEDLVWRSSTTGAIAVWFMNGAALGSVGSVTPSRGSDVNWRLAAVGDFDGDGKPDVVWRNQSTGANEIWLLDGLIQRAVVPIVPVADTGWQIVSAADFNGDGWPDLLWHHTSGANLILYMNGGTVIGSASLVSSPDSSWQIAGTPDLNGDAFPDAVWHHATDGLNFALLMQNATIVSVANLFSTGDPNWLPVSFADLNGDGRPDLVLRHQILGTAAVIYLDGTTAIGAALLPSTGDLTWSIVGPR